MYLEERVKKLQDLAQSLEKQANTVRSMRTNEDAPVWDSEWACELMTKYNDIAAHIRELQLELGL